MANTFALYFFFTIPSLSLTFFLFISLSQCLRTEHSLWHTQIAKWLLLYFALLLLLPPHTFITYILFYFTSFFCCVADSNQLFNFRNHHNVCVCEEQEQCQHFT